MWALAGVAMGAILGGGAQVVSASLQHRRERRTRIRDERREAYTGLLEIVNATHSTFTELHAFPQGIGPADMMDRAESQMIRARTLREVIFLTGPHEVWVSARNLVDALAQYGDSAARHVQQDLWKASVRFSERARIALDPPGRVNWIEVRRRLRRQPTPIQPNTHKPPGEWDDPRI